MPLRPAVVPPNRGFVIGAWIGGGALVASIAAAVIMRTPDAPVAPIAKVTVAPAAPIVVPVPITITPPASPPPPPAPAPVAPPIRAAAPFLQAACVLAEHAEASCAWDRGFPALSADGRTIIREVFADDVGHAPRSLTIELVDVATKKAKKSVLVFDVNEQYPEDPKLAAKIEQRVRVVQKLIAAGGYRSLERLAHVDDPNGGRLRVDRSDSVVRLVDTEQHRALHHLSFEPSVVFPGHVQDPDDMCGLFPRDPVVWWDDETRTMFATVEYSTGGCMCGDGAPAEITFIERVR